MSEKRSIKKEFRYKICLIRLTETSGGGYNENGIETAAHIAVLCADERKTPKRKLLKENQRDAVGACMRMCVLRA